MPGVLGALAAVSFHRLAECRVSNNHQERFVVLQKHVAVNVTVACLSRMLCRWLTPLRGGGSVCEEGALSGAAGNAAASTPRFPGGNGCSEWHGAWEPHIAHGEMIWTLRDETRKVVGTQMA